MRGSLCLAAGAIAGASLCAVAAPVASRAQTTAATGSLYVPAGVSKCLSKKGAISGIVSFAHPNPVYKNLLPPGLTDEVTIMSGFGPKVDPGALYFFRTNALAKAGEARLVATFIFFKDVPPSLAVVLSSGRKPPSAAAARSLHRVAQNAVVIWQYPRHHAALSDQTVSACLTPR